MHCNLRPLYITPVILCFNYAAHNATVSQISTQLVNALQLLMVLQIFTETDILVIVDHFSVFWARFVRSRSNATPRVLTSTWWRNMTRTSWFVSYFAACRMHWPHATTVSRRDQPSDFCASVYTWPLCHVWLAHLACGTTNMPMTPRCTLRLWSLISRRISIRLKNVLPLYISGYCTTVCSWIQANPRWFSSQLVEDVSKLTRWVLSLRLETLTESQARMSYGRSFQFIAADELEFNDNRSYWTRITWKFVTIWNCGPCNCSINAHNS